MNRPNENLALLRGLYVLVGASNPLPLARAALRGGARIIQLRDHVTPRDELRPTARELRRLTRDFGALCVVCDHLELAREVGADGLHLEWAPLSLEGARKELEGEMLLSTGVSSVEQALEAQRAGADALGVGPVYATKSKPDASAPIGLEGLQAIQNAVAIPIAAIGGLDSSNIGAVETPMACVFSALENLDGEAQIERVMRDLVRRFENRSL